MGDFEYSCLCGDDGDRDGMAVSSVDRQRMVARHIGRTVMLELRLCVSRSVIAMCHCFYTVRKNACLYPLATVGR